MASVLARLIGGTESRSTLRDPDDRFYEAIAGHGRSLAGVDVNPNTAFGLSSYMAAMRAISEDAGKLPLILYRKNADRGKKRLPNHPLYKLLHDEPNSEMSAITFWETMLSHAMGWGGGFAKIERNGLSVPQALWIITPDKIKVQRDVEGNIQYRHMLGAGGFAYYTKQNIFHLHGLGWDGLTGHSVAYVAKESLGAAMAARNSGAAFFGNGSRPGGSVEYPGKMDDDEYNRFRDSWEAAHGGSENANKTVILEGGMTFKPIAVPNADAQWIEAQQFGVEEVARWFRIPPHKIQHLLRATFSNIEHQSIEYVTDTLMPWLVRIEQEIKRKLIDTQEKAVFAEHLVDALLRGDTNTRFEAHAKARQWGWESANDVLELENRNPLPGDQGDIYLVPANMMPAERMLEEPEPEPEPEPVPPGLDGGDDGTPDDDKDQDDGEA